ncbi:MAG: hypothetical protein ACR2LH_03900 [Thermoleophilaceae bacterium]
MSHSDHDHVPAELRDVSRLLRDSRPELTALELDAIKRRAMSSAARTSPSFLTKQKEILMKSRLAVTSMLALGLLMSASGATLAVSGISQSGSAAAVQYTKMQEPDRSPQVGPLVLSDIEAGTPSDSGDPAAATDPSSDTQPVRQVASNEDESLPFTGFLAIPALIGGVGLLGSGLVLRRRMGKESDQA